MKITYNILLLPDKILDLNLELRRLGKDEQHIKKTIETTGIKAVRVVKTKQFSDFVFSGLERINKRYPDFFDIIDAVIVVSQSFDSRIPSVSTRIQKLFGIPETAFCLDIMDGCAGYIKALAIAKMLQLSGNKKILIVAGDLNSIMTAKAELGTRVLFGDGVSVSTIEPHYESKPIRLHNDGDHEKVISCSISENVLNMNGFEVFRFTRNRVPQLVNKYFEETKTTSDDYDLFAFHQASQLIVSTMIGSLGVKNKLCEDFLCKDIGNLGAGSIGAWLSQIHSLTENGPLNMIAVGYGSGLSWGVGAIVVDATINEVIDVQS